MPAHPPPDDAGADVLPDVSPDASWLLTGRPPGGDGSPAESALFALADGVIGISGAPLPRCPGVRRWALVGGVYAGSGPDTRLLTAPVAAQLAVDAAEPLQLERTLDMRSGLVHEKVETTAGPVRSVRFCSLARPGVVVIRACGPASSSAGPPLLAADDPPAGEGSAEAAVWMRTAGAGGGVVAAAGEVRAGDVLDRIAVYRGDPDTVPDPEWALADLADGASAGFDALLVEHRRSWASRWETADVVVDGDDDLQRAVRLALFHVMASVRDTDEAAVGARGLTGNGYRGHVFWDADTFTLPFLAATHPAAARAMIEYRLRRLPAAIEEAARLGRRGARFPWESAASGRDVTPRSARDRA
ncbi:MAG TPA: hypothetical protein VFH45_06365, partial [Acidimicrobiales bacterium]|nr:hypothetical protein [Acidimicrobiales bacterium]